MLPNPYRASIIFYFTLYCIILVNIWFDTIEIRHYCTKRLKRPKLKGYLCIVLLYTFVYIVDITYNSQSSLIFKYMAGCANCINHIFYYSPVLSWRDKSLQYETTFSENRNYWVSTESYLKIICCCAVNKYNLKNFIVNAQNCIRLLYMTKLLQTQTDVSDILH